MIFVPPKQFAKSMHFKTFLHLIFCALQFLIFAPGYALETLTLTDDQDAYKLGKYIELLADPNGELKIEDVISTDNSVRFQPSEDKIPNLGITGVVYWVRLRLLNNSERHREWLIDQGFTNTHYIDLYRFNDAENSYIVKKSGNLLANSQRDMGHRRPVFRLSIDQNEQTTVYFRIENGASMTIDLRIWSWPAFAEYDRSQSIFMGLFYGCLILLLAFSVYMYYQIREISYGWFSLFSATLIATMAFYDGLIQTWLSPVMAQWSRLGLPVFLSITIAALIKFNQIFIDTPKEARLTNIGQNTLFWCWLAMMAISFIVSYSTAITLMVPLIVLTLTVMFVMGFISWRYYKTISTKYLIAWSIFVLSFLELALTRYGVLDSTFITEHSFRASFVWLVFFMSLALVDRIEQLKLATEKANISRLESENRLHMALKAGKLGTWSWDIASDRIIGSTETEAIFGLPANCFDGKYDSYLKFIFADDRRYLQFSIRQALEQNMPYNVEHRFIRKDGESRWLAAYGEVIRDNENKVIAMAGTVQDITERKRNEEAIKNIAAGVSSQSGVSFFRQLTTQLAKLFDADYAFIGQLDERNQNLIHTCALSKHGIIMDNISYNLQDTPSANIVMKQATHTYNHDVQQVFPKDKLLKQLGIDSYAGAPLYNSYGKVIGIIAVLDSEPMHKVEWFNESLAIFAARAGAELERLDADQQLNSAQQKLSLHVQQTPLGVIEWNLQFEVVSWNPAAQRIFGYSSKEALGQRAIELLIPESAASQVDDVWHALLAKKGGTRSTNKNVTKNGNIITCEWYNTPLVSDDGDVVGVASLVEDISERVQAQTELTEHKNHLEELIEARTSELKAANEELESFSYSVSHDLRAPLRTINGFSQALVEDCNDQLDEQGKSYLKRLRVASRNMDTLIQDMLALSRVTRLELKLETISLSHMVEEILHEYEERDPQKSISYTVQKNLNCYCDSQLMRIALDNLLANAWKYTGNIDKAVIEFGSKPSRGDPVYYIKDNGAGFDMKYAGQIYTAFKRLHGQSEFEGSGVGLATVSRVLRRFNGHIWAKAKPNLGATFYFTIPTKARLKSYMRKLTS